MGLFYPPLTPEGKKQAEQLAERLNKFSIKAVFSSPLERAIETAEQLARKLGLKIEISEQFKEIDFGDWTGKTFEELEGNEGWKQWNRFRSAAQIPNGERMLDVQARVVGELERLRRVYPDGTVAVFGHGDPIKAALIYYLGLPLDHLLRLETNPAGFSEVRISDWHVQVVRLNQHLE